ncbi:hypothetical protein HK097_001866 [Rhizophlyctis rosea]|uniref:Uncharacterized protein n=1 Tax=Rhizophlyctis rosea TaxID=64517 RepID=A0AAD5S695_9FUNG|nr:hypothetical protein HK097_001866 [Rhizophlyctis rosea]
MHLTLPIITLLALLAPVSLAQKCTTEARVRSLTGQWNAKAAECKALTSRSRSQYDCICGTEYRNVTNTVWTCVDGTAWEGNFNEIRETMDCICKAGFTSFTANPDNCAVSTTTRGASGSRPTTTAAAGNNTTSAPAASATPPAASPTAAVAGTSGAVGRIAGTGVLAGVIGVAVAVLGV